MQRVLHEFDRGTGDRSLYSFYNVQRFTRRKIDQEEWARWVQLEGDLRMNIKPEDSEVLSEDVKEYIFNRDAGS